MKQRLKHLWDNFELYTMVLLMVSFFLVIFWSVFMRAVFHNPPTWSEELSRILFIWMVMLGYGFCTKYDKHIRITYVLDRLPSKARIVADILYQLTTFVLFAWIFYNGIQYVAFCSSTISPVLQIPRSIMTSILPITGCIVMIRVIERLIHSIKSLAHSTSNRKEDLS